MQPHNSNEVMPVARLTGIDGDRRVTLREWYAPPSVEDVERALELARSLSLTRVRLTRHFVPLPF